MRGVNEMTTEELINDIRLFEADHGLKPATIKKSAEGGMTVTVDKSVLYQYDANRKNSLQKFWSWLNDSDNSFNPDNHANQLQKAIEGPLNISVRKRFKQLPVPYFSIPVPIKNSGTKIREYGNLATQKIKVSMTFSSDYDSKKAIQQILLASIISDDTGQDLKLPTAARRESVNPIKWGLHLLSKLVPRSVGQGINKRLPNLWIKATRPNEWGTFFCDARINHGFINSGATASIMNTLIVAPLTFGRGARLCDDEAPPSLFGDSGGVRRHGNDFQYQSMNENTENTKNYINYSYTDRLSLFFQTRAKLSDVVPGGISAGPKRTTELINRALHKTFGR